MKTVLAQLGLEPMVNPTLPGRHFAILDGDHNPLMAGADDRDVAVFGPFPTARYIMIGPEMVQ